MLSVQHAVHAFSQNAIVMLVGLDALRSYVVRDMLKDDPVSNDWTPFMLVAGSSDDTSNELFGVPWEVSFEQATAKFHGLQRATAETLILDGVVAFELRFSANIEWVFETLSVPCMHLAEELDLRMRRCGELPAMKVVCGR